MIVSCFLKKKYCHIFVLTCLILSWWCGTGEVSLVQVKTQNRLQPGLSRKHWLNLFKKPPVWYTFAFSLWISDESLCSGFNLFIFSPGRWCLPTCAYAAHLTRSCPGYQHTSKNPSLMLRYLYGKQGWQASGLEPAASAEPFRPRPPPTDLLNPSLSLCHCRQGFIMWFHGWLRFRQRLVEDLFQTCSSSEVQKEHHRCLQSLHYITNFKPFLYSFVGYGVLTVRRIMQVSSGKPYCDFRCVLTICLVLLMAVSFYSKMSF